MGEGAPPYPRERVHKKKENINHVLVAVNTYALLNDWLGEYLVQYDRNRTEKEKRA